MSNKRISCYGHPHLKHLALGNSQGEMLRLVNLINCDYRSMCNVPNPYVGLVQEQALQGLIFRFMRFPITILLKAPI